MRILVIEDEPRMSALLFKGLSEHSHNVTVALNGAEGLKCTLDSEFEVILLDLGLPDLSGYDVAQVLRERRYPGSILMLTAYNKEDEIVRGLNIGADDYLVKPFSFPELLARLRAITRSLPEPTPKNVTIDDMIVDKVQHKVRRRGQGIDLTRTEFLLLEALADNSPHVVSRAKLITEIWGEQAEVTPGALDVLVNSLRSKVDAPFSRKLLQTVRGSGYLLRADQSLTGNAPTECMRRRIQ
jgi:DNA-binding response OmpR family regulator